MPSEIAYPKESAPGFSRFISGEHTQLLWGNRLKSLCENLGCRAVAALYARRKFLIINAGGQRPPLQITVFTQTLKPGESLLLRREVT
jgi:hypothetical protein